MKLYELFEQKAKHPKEIPYDQASIKDRNTYDSYFFYKDNPEYDKFSVVIGTGKPWGEFATAAAAQIAADGYNRKNPNRRPAARARVVQNY